MRTMIHATLDIGAGLNAPNVRHLDGYRFTQVTLDDPEMTITVWDAESARTLAGALLNAADQLDAKAVSA